jgi:glycosyltransferase involved in cell wall biosynthesis
MWVSVIIPVYNRPKLVIDAINSVLDQTRKADEILVIDDGSTDETASVLEQFVSSSQAPVRLLSSRHVGAPAARNLGMDRARPDADLFAFLDSDDLWPSCFLERTTRLMARAPDAVAASCDQHFQELDSGTDWRLDSKPLEQSPWRHMIRNGAGLGSCTLFRAAAVRAEKGFPEDFPTGHDCILFALVAKRGKWLHAPGAPVVFRRNYEASFPTENTHLHRAYPDFRARWATTLQFIHDCAPIEVREDPATKAALRDIWKEAAEQALRNSRQSDANRYLERALEFEIADPEEAAR